MHFRRTSFQSIGHLRQISTALLVVLLAQPFIALAQSLNTIDYEYILSDGELVSYQTMDRMDIQRFLERRNSYLANFFTTLDTGERASAIELIYRASQNHRINPQFLLALLQKEQSLIETQTPTQNQLDWATGYGCLDNQPCNERWRGFHKQINSAAEQFRYYYEHISEYNFRPGKTSVVDGQVIIPKNTVTAALYNYTPHLQGNRLFKTIWDSYFVTRLPDGTLAQIKGEPGVWLIQAGTKRAFTSRLALVSRYSPNVIVQVDKSDLDIFDRGPDIQFPAYALLSGATSGSIYLLTVDQKRLIESKDVFRTLGFNPEEVDEVSDEQLAAIPDGRPITIADSHPTGTLLQDSVTGGVFYVELGRKYPILAKEVLRVNFPNRKIVKARTTVLESYATGFPVQFKEGTLLKGSAPTVYVVSNEKKRPIASERAFNGIGYAWKNIIVVSDAALEMLGTGDPVDLK